MIGFALALLLAVMALAVIRLVDWRADRAERNRLAVLQPEDPELFDPTIVADLPEPARRYFAYMFRPGTRTHSAITDLSK